MQNTTATSMSPEFGSKNDTPVNSIRRRWHTFSRKVSASLYQISSNRSDKHGLTACQPPSANGQFQKLPTFNKDPFTIPRKPLPPGVVKDTIEANYYTVGRGCGRAVPDVRHVKNSMHRSKTVANRPSSPIVLGTPLITLEEARKRQRLITRDNLANVGLTRSRPNKRSVGLTPLRKEDKSSSESHSGAQAPCFSDLASSQTLSIFPSPPRSSALQTPTHRPVGRTVQPRCHQTRDPVPLPSHQLKMASENSVHPATGTAENLSQGDRESTGYQTLNISDLYLYRGQLRNSVLSTATRNSELHWPFETLPPNHLHECKLGEQFHTFRYSIESSLPTAVGNSHSSIRCSSSPATDEQTLSSDSPRLVWDARTQLDGLPRLTKNHSTPIPQCPHIEPEPSWMYLTRNESLSRLHHRALDKIIEKDILLPQARDNAGSTRVRFLDPGYPHREDDWPEMFIPPPPTPYDAMEPTEYDDNDLKWWHLEV